MIHARQLGPWRGVLTLDLLGIPGTLVVQGGAVGALTFVVLAIVTGKLLPRRTVDDMLKERDRAIATEQARGDEWRKTAEAQDARNDLQARQIEHLLEATRTTNALIEGLRRASERHQ